MAFPEDEPVRGARASPARRSSTVPFLHDAPIDNPPQRLEVRGAAVLVVEVVGVFPDVEGQEGAEAGVRPFDGLRDRTADGIAGTGLLGDDEGAVGSRGKPDPAGAEEGGAGGDEGGLEGGEGAPLGLDPSLEGPGRPFDKLRDRPFDRLRDRPPDRRTELRKVQVVVQDLAGVVEDGFSGRSFDRLRIRPGGGDHNLFERKPLVGRPGNELIQIVHVALQVLAVVKSERAGGNDGLQRVNRIG